MAQFKNGRVILGPIGEAEGIARVITTGQRVCTSGELVAKLKRYIDDKNKSPEDRAMYEAQLEDVMGELTNG